MERGYPRGKEEPANWETPHKMASNTLKRRICGAGMCERCEVMCAFGKEYLKRSKHDRSMLQGVPKPEAPMDG